MGFGWAIWIVLGIVYAAFFAWYTSFRGPLTTAEIERYLRLLERRGMPSERLALFRKFFETDTGRDFAMLNVIEFRAQPIQAEGVSPGETASSALNRYMRHMWPALLKRACHPVTMGRAAAPALDVWGIEGAAEWSQAALMRYRSRRDLAEIATEPGMVESHEFKVAAMAKTVAFPIDPWFHLSDPRLLLAILLLVVGLVLA
jgi:hypothetical protein